MQLPRVAWVDNVTSANNILRATLPSLQQVLSDIFHVQKRITDAIPEACILKEWD